MTSDEFVEFINLLDEEEFKPFLNEIYKNAQKHYNELILDGWDTDDAMYEVVTKTAYITLKRAVSLCLFFHLNVQPDLPKTKKELKDLLKIIK